MKHDYTTLLSSYDISIKTDAEGCFNINDLNKAAMWISPKLHLKVIRAYDQFQTEGVAVALD